MVFGSVQDIFVAGVGAPLIYANRAYGVPRRFHQRRSPRRGAAAGALTVGCDQVLAPYVLPALVARLTKLHPDIALTLVEADHEHLIASLRRNDIEIALLYDFGLGDDLRSTPLAELTPYVLLAEGHPLRPRREHRARRSGAANPWRCSTSNRAGNIFCRCFESAAWNRHIGYRTKIAGNGAGFRRSRIGLQHLGDQAGQQHDLRRARTGGAAAQRRGREQPAGDRGLDSRTLSAWPWNSRTTAVRCLAQFGAPRLAMPIGRGPICARRLAKLITCRPKQSALADGTPRFAHPPKELHTTPYDTTRIHGLATTAIKPTRAAKPADWRGEDPNLELEKSRYADPIASRELLLKHLARGAGALDRRAPRQALGAAHRRRSAKRSPNAWRAMVRDGQAIEGPNGFATAGEGERVAGRVRGRANGDVLVMPDDGSAPLVLARADTATLMHSDRVEVLAVGMNDRGRRIARLIRRIGDAPHRIGGVWHAGDGSCGPRRAGRSRSLVLRSKWRRAIGTAPKTAIMSSSK